MLENLTPEQKSANDLASAWHSVNLVNELVSSTDYTATTASKEVLETIDRNYRHLEIVLNREWVIANSAEPLTPFQNTAIAGNNYITLAKSTNNANAEGITV